MKTGLNGNGMNGFLESVFNLSQNNTDTKTEFVAGLTTFLTSAYIIAVNPSILSNTGMDTQSVFVATVLISGLASIAMGIFANFPYALAPAMGLNAYFAYYVVGVQGLTWQNALACVLMSGLVFLFMSLFKIRKKIVNEMPHCIKQAVGAGIGFFIAFIGLTDSGIIVSSKDTVVKLGNLGNPGTLLAIVGIGLMAVLIKKRVRGGILIGIFAITIVGLFVTNPETGLTYSQWPKGGIISFENPFRNLAPTFGQLSFKGLLSNFESSLSGILFIVFGFVFVDMFDTIAVLIGVSTKAGFLDENGELPGAGKALLVDASATTLGAILGTSTVTTYGAESATGVAEGGRTGLVAVFVGILFLSTLLFSPLFLMIPTIATAPALVMVGVFMMEPLKNIELDDFAQAFPTFLAVIFMPLTYSIAHGILFAVLGYTLVNTFTNREKISPTVWILSGVFIIYLLAEVIH